jgi:hypothetical protein
MVQTRRKIHRSGVHLHHPYLINTAETSIYTKIHSILADAVFIADEIL